MVFMAHRVLFLSSAWLLFACNTQTELPTFNADSLQLVNKNGIVYVDEHPFTGHVIERTATNDTVLFYGFYKGKEHGVWKHFYANNQLAEWRYYDKGMKTKTLTRWWPNGQKQFHCSFENGEYEGLLQEWNENGQLTKEMHYHNGYESGSQKMYYNNGKIRSNYVVKNGKRIGLLGTKNCINVSDSIFNR